MIFGLVGFGILLLIGAIFSISWKIMKKLVLSSILGLVLLVGLNLLGAPLGLTIPVRPLSAFIAGFFGWPGILVILFFRYIA